MNKRGRERGDCAPKEVGTICLNEMWKAKGREEGVAEHEKWTKGVKAVRNDDNNKEDKNTGARKIGEGEEWRTAEKAN